MKKSDLNTCANVAQFVKLLGELNGEKRYNKPAFGREADHCIALIEQEGLAPIIDNPSRHQLRTKVTRMSDREFTVRQGRSVRTYKL